jgi:glutaminase
MLPPGKDPITTYLGELYDDLMPVDAGEVASYIPELAKADPGHLGIAIATADGRLFEVGDSDIAFTIQSVSKPFAYGHALACHGRAAVLARVGVEPTGDRFNSIVLDEETNTPYNPMVNAGAIAVAELYPGDTREERIGAMRSVLSRFAGRELTVDETIFLSEKLTGHRNRAIAYLMRSTDMLRRDPEDVLDIYFQQCSMMVNCRDLAVMAATLANRGVNPFTGELAMPSEFVQDVLTVMQSCGMYDYAGHWSYEVGVPAKSGVSGCVIAVVPGQIGIAAYSPRLDAHGNSVRAIMACLKISASFGLHVFRGHPGAVSVFRQELKGLQIRSKRVRPAAERAILDRNGRAVRIIEAQGDLFFASAERLVHRIGEISATASHIIVDFRYVQRADEASARLLNGLADIRVNPAIPLIFSNVPKKSPLGGFCHAPVSEEAAARTPLVFEELNAALEYVEDQILDLYRSAAPDGTLSLSEMAIFQNLDSGEMRLLVEEVNPKLVIFEKDQIVFRKGELGTVLFAIARGFVSMELPPVGSSSRTIQVASMGKGLTFGETVLIDGQPRAFQAVAECELACYAIAVNALRTFGQRHPAIYVKILMNIIHDLSDKLRFADETVQGLERL